MARQHQRQTRAPVGARPAVIAAVAFAAAAFSPVLLLLDQAAYPREPEKRQALDLCSRTDPTFVRFLAANRDACYDRFSGLTVAAAGGVLQPNIRPPSVHPGALTITVGRQSGSPAPATRR